MKNSTLFILLFILAVIFDVLYWVVIRKRGEKIKTEVLAVNVKLQQLIPHAWSRSILTAAIKEFLSKHLVIIIEIVIILLFALWVGRDYLDLKENTWPFGYEFPLSVQSHYNWIKLKECGLCFLWNGSIKGGAPSFVDLRGSWLHPIVAVATLGFGFINGSKVSILAFLFLAGLASWLIAKILKVGLVPRLFSATMAIVAGNMSASMQMGDIGRLFSHVSASLALAAGLCFAKNPNKRNAVALGIMVALLLISGQGYNQAGFALCVLPALLVLFNKQDWKDKRTWKNVLLAGILALLLAGFFLVPLLHFLPQTYKDIDVNFRAVQPIQFIPLNLLIDNYAFYLNDNLGKLPYFSLYSIYLGWIPILLLVLSFVFVRKSNFRAFLFFVVTIILVLLASSGITFKLLAYITDFAYGFRHPSVISGLLIPPILGLAALGLDSILNLHILRWSLHVPGKSGKKVISINLMFLLVIIPLFFSIRSAYNFSHPWYTTVSLPHDQYRLIQYLNPDQTEWVKTPYGSHIWLIPALEMDIKIGEAFRDWNWKERLDPPPYLEIAENITGIEPLHPVKIAENAYLISSFTNEYAFITSKEGDTPCVAHASGGHIDVICDSAHGGILTVMENSWAGWTVKVDGEHALLIENQRWLTVKAEPGQHNFVFNYFPLDVLIGFILTLAGIVIALFVLFKRF